MCLLLILLAVSDWTSVLENLQRPKPAQGLRDSASAAVANGVRARDRDRAYR